MRQDNINGVSSSWSTQLLHKRAAPPRWGQLMQTCVGASHSDLSSAGLKQLLRSPALSQPWNNFWITELVLTQYIFADRPYRASPSCSWRAGEEGWGVSAGIYYTSFTTEEIVLCNFVLWACGCKSDVPPGLAAELGGKASASACCFSPRLKVSSEHKSSCSHSKI